MLRGSSSLQGVNVRRTRPCGSGFTSALIAVTTALILGSAAHASGAGTAVAFQIDVAHDGVQTDLALRPPFVRRWQATFTDTVQDPVLIADGKVFVTASEYPSHGSRLYALSVATGEIIWSQPIPDVYWWSAAGYDNGRVFDINTNGVLRAFDAEDGTPLWTAGAPGGGFATRPPIADGGVVYATGTAVGGGLVAFDETDGHVIANQPLFGGRSPVTLSDSAVFVTDDCQRVYAFERAILTPLWSVSGSCYGGLGAPSFYAAGTLYTGDYLGSHAFDAITGAPLGDWAPPNGGMFPVIDGDLMWGNTSVTPYGGGTLIARPAAGGSPLWSFSGDGGLFQAPIVIKNPFGRFVIDLSQSGKLYALSGATGAVLWTDTLPWWNWPQVGPNQGYLAAGQGVLVVPMNNTLTAYGSDFTPPTLSVPDHVTAAATSASGTSVSFSVTATDPDSPATVTCSPDSGSLFPIGTTTVSCTASDPSGNTTQASFRVVVSAPGASCDLSRYPRQKGALVLKNANLSGCYLPDADLTGAAATNANLLGTDLERATLSGANLTQANLASAVLRNANLTNANLASATLRGADLTGATLIGVTWSKTTCPDGTTSDADGGTCAGH